MMHSILGFGLATLSTLLFATAATCGQSIIAGHLNVGAVITNAGSQLTFANGAAFVLESGYVPMSLTTEGKYSGLYGSGPTLTALAQTVAHGGPIANAPSFGSFIQFSMTLQSAPVGGAFSFWDSGALSPTYSFGAVGATSPMWALSGGPDNLTAGSPGADPFGHIHGRRFTATEPGEYIITFQAFDSSLNGAQHMPSELLEVRFLAIPEPSGIALLALAAAVAVVALIYRRKLQGVQPRKLTSNTSARMVGFIGCFAAIGGELRATEVVADPPPLSSEIQGWMETNSVGSIEQRIENVEAWGISSPERAQVFFRMFEKLEPDERRRISHAAVKCVPDTNFVLIRRHLLDSGLPRPVLSVFMTDTLKRRNSLKMPTLLELAKKEGHPMQSESVELLRVYLGSTYGRDWGKWEQAMKSWLQQHPD